MGFATTKATWACWALLLALTGLAVCSDITDTEFSELLQAVKQGTFTLGGRGQDDSKQILEGILDKSKPFIQYYFLEVLYLLALHTLV